MELGTIVMAVISLMIAGMLTGLFIWLTDGWLSPGISVVLMGIACVFLFTVFGWILLIALAVIASAFAGFLFTDSNSS
jgi:hypothetical protein